MKQPSITMSKGKLFKMLAIIFGALLALALVIVIAIYVWPLRSSYLQTGVMQSVSYDESIKRIDERNNAERDMNVITGCTSHVYSHGAKTKKAVVMLHGVTACPSQFEGLAKVFYDAGYNVYVPLAPHHGLADKKEHGKVTAKELVDYVNESVTTTTGLGDEIGAVGLSGGGMLTTWAAEYRPEIKQALALSPFYEPAAGQAPKWQLPLLNVLYGFGILPDTYVVPATPDGASFSYHALANYNIVTKNLKSNPTGLPLKNFSVITSNDDDQIDLDLAHKIPQNIAKANPNMVFKEANLPAEWKLGHDIVSLQNKEVAARQDDLFRLYLDSYEGK